MTEDCSPPQRLTRSAARSCGGPFTAYGKRTSQKAPSRRELPPLRQDFPKRLHAQWVTKERLFPSKKANLTVRLFSCAFAYWNFMPLNFTPGPIVVEMTTLLR